MQYTLRATKEKSLIGTQTVLRPRRSGCIYLDKDIQHKLRKKVKYLFGRPSIPSYFLKKIVASNFRDKRNLMSVVFGLLKMSF